MNAAVKTLTNRGWALVWNVPVTITRQHVLMMGLALAVLLSAFALVYVKDMNRRLTSQAESLKSNNVELHNHWTQLLLKKSALANQAHVAKLARQNFDMKMPDPDSVKMI